MTLIPFFLPPDLDSEGAAKESCSSLVEPSATLRTEWRVSCGARKGLCRDAKAERWVRGVGRMVCRVVAVCFGGGVGFGWGRREGMYNATI